MAFLAFCFYVGCLSSLSLHFLSMPDKLSAGAASNFQTTVFSVCKFCWTGLSSITMVADFFRSGSFVSFWLFVLVSVGAPAVIVAIISRFNDRIAGLARTRFRKFTTKQISTKS